MNLADDVRSEIWRRGSWNAIDTTTADLPVTPSGAPSASGECRTSPCPWPRCCILRVTTTSTPSSSCRVFARELAECVAPSRGVLRGSLLDVRQRLWPMPASSIVTRAERVGFSASSARYERECTARPALGADRAVRVWTPSLFVLLQARIDEDLRTCTVRNKNAPFESHGNVF